MSVSRTPPLLPSESEGVYPNYGKTVITLCATAYRLLAIYDAKRCRRTAYRPTVSLNLFVNHYDTPGDYYDKFYTYDTNDPCFKNLGIHQKEVKEFMAATDQFWCHADIKAMSDRDIRREKRAIENFGNSLENKDPESGEGSPADVNVLLAKMVDTMSILATGQRPLDSVNATNSQKTVERFKPEYIGYFYPDFDAQDTDAKTAAGDIIHLGDKVYYKDVNLFIDQVRNNASIYGDTTVALRLHECLRGVAASWYVQLSDFQKEAFRHSPGEWKRLLLARFQLTLNEAGRMYEEQSFTIQDVRQNRSPYDYILNTTRYGKACGVPEPLAISHAWRCMAGELQRDIAPPDSATTTDDFIKAMLDKMIVWKNVYGTHDGPIRGREHDRRDHGEKSDRSDRKGGRGGNRNSTNNNWQRSLTQAYASRPYTSNFSNNPYYAPPLLAGAPQPSAPYGGPSPYTSNYPGYTQGGGHKPATGQVPKPGMGSNNNGYKPPYNKPPSQPPMRPYTQNPPPRAQQGGGYQGEAYRPPEGWQENGIYYTSVPPPPPDWDYYNGGYYGNVGEFHDRPPHYNGGYYGDTHGQGCEQGPPQGDEHQGGHHARHDDSDDDDDYSADFTYSVHQATGDGEPRRSPHRTKEPTRADISTMNALANNATHLNNEHISPDATEVDIRPAKPHLQQGLGYRRWFYSRVKASLSRHGSLHWVTPDSGCNVSMIDRQFLYENCSEAKIMYNEEGVTIRPVGNQVLKAHEYAVIDIFMPTIDGGFVRMPIEAYLTEDLKANLLIGNDLLGPNEAVLSFKRHTMEIGRARVHMEVVRRSENTLARARRTLRAANTVTIPPQSALMVPVSYKGTLPDRDLLVLPRMPGVLPQLIDGGTGAILVANVSNEPRVIDRRMKLGHAEDESFDEMTTWNATAATPEHHIHRMTAEATKEQLSAEERPFGPLERRLDNGITAYGTEEQVRAYRLLTGKYARVWEDTGMVNLPEED